MSHIIQNEILLGKDNVKVKTEDLNFVTFHSKIPQGKVQIKKGEITSEYVEAICRLYNTRSDAESEYMLEESAIVEREPGMDLSSCFNKAMNIAYENAVLHVAPTPKAEPRQKLTPVPKPEPTPKAEPEPKPAPAPETEPEPQQEPETEQKPESMPLSGQSEQEQPETIFDRGEQQTIPQRLDLVPAVVFPNVDASEPDDELLSAKNVKITALGKLHLCFGWTAGRILDEQPQVIVEFAPKCSDLKLDEKNALMALYPEACRRVAAAA